MKQAAFDRCRYDNVVCAAIVLSSSLTAHDTISRALLLHKLSNPHAIYENLFLSYDFV